MRRVRFGAHLTDETGARPCRIGAFVTDATGALFVLSALHVLEAWHGSTALDSGGRGVGSAIREPVSEGRRPLWTAIGRIRLDEDVRPDEAHLHAQRLAAECGWPALGQRVSWRSGSGARVSGVVVAKGGCVTLRNPHLDSVEDYDDFVEVAFDAAEIDRFQPGEAGGAVVLEDGRLLGLIIAGSPACCYVAPLAPCLSEQGLALWTALPEEAAHTADIFSDLLNLLTLPASPAFERLDADPPAPLRQLERRLEFT